MKTKYLILFFCYCVFISCKKEMDDSDTSIILPGTTLVKTGLVTGLVYDDYDQALSDHIIELYVNGSMLDQVRTNDLGEYEIEAPIAKDQDARLFAYGPNFREVLRQINFEQNNVSIDFPMTSTTDESVPSITPEDPDLIVVKGIYNDPGGQPARGYIRIHDQSNETVDVVSRPDRSGYYELFVPADKALILEMVERCREEEVFTESIGPLVKELTRDFTSKNRYDTEEIYRVVGNITDCQGGSLDQYGVVTFTLNEFAVTPPLPSSQIFYFPCESPINNGDQFNFFIRDRFNKKKSDLLVGSVEDFTLNYGNITLCNDDPRALTLIYGDKTVTFSGDELNPTFADIGPTLIGVASDPDAEVKVLEMNIKTQGVTQPYIKYIMLKGPNGEIILDYEDTDSSTRLTFDEVMYCQQKDKDCQENLFEGGIHNGTEGISVSIYAY